MQKVYHILLNQLLTVFSEQKVPETWELYLSTDLAAGKIFCMYVCIHARGDNFYPIDTKYGVQIGLVKCRVKFKEGPCRSHRDRHQKIHFSNFSTKSLIFDLKLSLERVHQDLKHCLWG